MVEAEAVQAWARRGLAEMGEHNLKRYLVVDDSVVS